MEYVSGAHSEPSSLTESLEAAMEIEKQCFRILSFSCVGDLKSGGNSFSPDSYLASGSLKRILLGLDPFPIDYEDDIVELFGFQWVTETALVESCALLFGLFRQQIHKLENLVQSSSSDFGQAAKLHSEAGKMRQRCIEFLQYVKVFIFRYLEPHESEVEQLHPYEKQEAQLPSLLVEELYSLTLHIGRLFDLPGCVLGGFTLLPQAKLFPPSWHLLHLYIDIHWSVLEILHLLGEKMQRRTIYAHRFTNLTGENLTNISLFEDHCGNLLYDLIGLSVKRFSKVRLSETLTSYPYPCICVKELWILLIHLLDHRNKGSLTESLWNWLNKILKKVFQNISGPDEICAFESIPCNDPLSFSWWLITHLASLYHFDRNGHVDNKKPVKSNWPYVEDLLKQSICQAGILEEQLRMHLQCCLTLSHIWEVNLTIVTMLWEHYCKNLNNPFTIRWFGLKDLANINKTPLSMYELIKSYCSDICTPDMYMSCNSYQFFLHILAQIMKKAEKMNGIHPWKQIKGRIYSKFHQKRMCELTEGGLQNFLHLFLVLGSLAETEDVVSRMMELLQFLSPVSTTVAQRALIWKGYFAFILTYVDKSMDISVLAEQLSVVFCEKAKEFLVARNDFVQKQNLWKLLSTYVEGVQEVFESSVYLNLSEEKLLSDGFCMLLPGCRGAELSAVLNFLQEVLFRLRTTHKEFNQRIMLRTSGPNAQPSSVVKEHHLAASRALWRNFFPYLKSQRIMKAPPPQLADTAAGLTLLALELPSTCPSDLQPQPIVSMLQLFGWDHLVCPQLVSRYLTHLIQNSALTEALIGMGHTSYQALFVQSWFRCVLQMFINYPPETLIRTDAEQTTDKVYVEQLTEFTRQIFRLPEVGAIFSKAHIDESAYKQDPRDAVLQFIKAIGQNYSGLQLLPEKSAMVAKALVYLGDVLKYVKPYLIKKGPAEGLHLTYKIIGCLVKFWAAILATSKAQALLLGIVDCLLLPHAVLQQDKELPAVMLSAIRENLPFFLQGLSFICCHCQSQTQTAYLNQLLRNVIQQYLGRFLLSPVTSPGRQHPILLALSSSPATSEAIHLHKTSVQVISENYLQFKGHAPLPHLGSVLAFTLEVLQRNNNTEICDVEKLLPSVLKCLVLINEPRVKKLSTEILQYIVKGCQAGLRGELSAQLISVFRHFIQDYITVYDNQVYSILEAVTVLDQSLVIGLIPALTEALRNSEYKQGLGRNTLKRDAYKRLLSQLTEAGQTEILKLENEFYL